MQKKVGRSEHLTDLCWTTEQEGIFPPCFRLICVLILCVLLLKEVSCSSSIVANKEEVPVIPSAIYFTSFDRSAE